MDREWETLSEAPKIGYLLDEKLVDVALCLKGSSPPEGFILCNKKEDLYEFSYPPDAVIEKRNTIYATLKRQIEIDLEFVQHVDDGRALFRPLEARIAKQVRNYDRIIVKDDELTTSDFVMSKGSAADTLSQAQEVGREIIYRQLEKAFSGIMKGVRIYGVRDKTAPEWIRELSVLQQSLIIPKPILKESYDIDLDGDFNIGSLLEARGVLGMLLKDIQKRNPGALILVPARAEMSGQCTTEALLVGELEADALDMEDTIRSQMEAAAEAAMKRVMDANMIRVPERQTALDISEGGISLKIDQTELQKYIKLKSHLTFDLIFKMQAPLRMHSVIRHIRKNNSGFVAGLDLEGSAHSDMKMDALRRLKSFIKLIGSDAG